MKCTKQSDWFSISDYDALFTALGVEYKAKQNRCRELDVLPKFQSKNFLKKPEWIFLCWINNFEGKKRLHVV